MYFKPFNLTRPISANSVVIIQFILIIPFVETVCLLAFFFLLTQIARMINERIITVLKYNQ